jgi:hypothetical protein
MDVPPADAVIFLVNVESVLKPEGLPIRRERLD